MGHGSLVSSSFDYSQTDSIVCSMRSSQLYHRESDCWTTVFSRIAICESESTTAMLRMWHCVLSTEISVHITVLDGLTIVTLVRCSGVSCLA